MLCDTCKSKIVKHVEKMLPVDDNITVLQAGRIYGTNSRKIYEKCCDSLGWKRSNASYFGWQTPLYADNCDKDNNGVWFIFYPNYSTDSLESVVEDAHVLNVILYGGDVIVEVLDKHFGGTHNANRITFVKTKSGYEFLGVYSIEENGNERIYKRISKTYPVTK